MTVTLHALYQHARGVIRYVSSRRCRALGTPPGRFRNPGSDATLSKTFFCARLCRNSEPIATLWKISIRTLSSSASGSKRMSATAKVTPTVFSTTPREPYVCRQGLRMLDVGCGAGGWHARATQAGARLVGVDLMQACFARRDWQVRIYNRRQSFCQADAQALPFRDAAFDRVLCAGVLYHVPRLRARAARDQTRTPSRVVGQ